MKGIRFARIAILTAGLLLIPLIAMQFTDQVNWNVFDFLVAGAMLFLAGCAVDFMLKKTGQRRVWGIAFVILVFLWLWAELAVGVFTNWGS